MSKSIPAAPGQMDLLEVLEEAKRELPSPCLFNSPARGLASRSAEFGAWREAYGSFGSIPRSHAWTLPLTCPSKPTERCQPTVLKADVRARCSGDRRPEPECGCTRIYDDLMHRGACTGCDWEGLARGGRHNENAAAEDACDHAHPGWRDLPHVPRVPSENGPRDKYAKDRWIAHVTELYPAGWLEAGGPIRTRRRPVESRHVPCQTPFGGYDMAVPEQAGGHMSPVPKRCPFKAGDRIQMHGYPGCPPGYQRSGFRGAVEGSMGSTLLHGTTDDGQPWVEFWGALQKDGEPNLSAARCTCCPGGRTQIQDRSNERNA